jgi:hypothetical protein
MDGATVMANPNVFAQFIRPIRGVEEYQADQADLESRQQQNALGRMALGVKAGELQRAEQKRNALAAIASGWTPDTPDEQKIADLRRNPYTMDLAEAMAKSIFEQRKAEADVGKTEAETRAKKIETARNLVTYGIQALQTAQTPQQAAALVNDGVARQYWSMDQARQMLSDMPSDQTNFERWRAIQMRQVLDLEKQLPKTGERDLGGMIERTVTDPTTGATSMVGRVQKTMTPGESARLAEDRRQFGVTESRLAGAADAPTWDATNRVWVDKKTRTVVPGVGPDDKPIPSPRQASPMSATLQKELIEADDAVQTNRSIQATLKAALDLNDTAYSGYAAKGRAVVRSNLPGQSPEADATINLDNMMTGQALESLKAIFGGMPTEGERKVLLDMQASADKTPLQRKAIINRAIAAAARRAKAAEAKAAAIRGGTYLTEGFTPPETPEVPSGAEPVKSGTDLGGGFRVK